MSVVLFVTKASAAPLSGMLGMSIDGEKPAIDGGLASIDEGGSDECIVIESCAAVDRAAPKAELSSELAEYILVPGEIQLARRTHVQIKFGHTLEISGPQGTRFRLDRPPRHRA